MVRKPAVPRRKRTRASNARGPTSPGPIPKSRTEHELQERVKELTCLYGLNKVIEGSQGRRDELLQGAADLLPPSWQYPDIACAKIRVEDDEYVSAGFAEGPHEQSAPITVAGRDAGLVEVRYLEERPPEAEGPFLEEERWLIDAVADRLGHTIGRLRVEHDLRERVKELRCLHGISELVERCQGDLPKLMRGVVELLPPSWQYPDVACARIVYEGQEFATVGFKETRYRQTAPVRLAGKTVGTVEVCYVQRRPASDEGPFLKEERALIDAVAERLGRTAEWITAEQELRQAHAQLQVERKALQDSNSALRTVLARIEDEKGSIKQAVVANVEKILMPILHALELRIDADQKGYVRLLRHHLEEIASPLVDRLSRRALALTPSEIQICGMVKMGMSTKEIAAVRHVAPATVSRQRERIRKKLGLTNKGVNLATFLQTFATAAPGVSRRPGAWPGGPPRQEFGHRPDHLTGTGRPGLGQGAGDGGY